MGRKGRGIVEEPADGDHLLVRGRIGDDVFPDMDCHRLWESGTDLEIRKAGSNGMDCHALGKLKANVYGVWQHTNA